MSKFILETCVIVNGKEWRLYSVDYQTCEGTFSTYIYAVSFEHAAAIVEEMKETAKLSGCIHSQKRVEND